jgi:trk system potassium uptake protein TrkH
MAVTYALSSVSTGGFAPKDASLGGLVGWTSPALVTIACLAGSIALGWYRRAVSQGFRAFLEPQVRMLLTMGGAFVLLTALTQVLSGDASLYHIAQRAPLMALSAQSTAGFANIEPSLLDEATRFLLIVAMIVGGGVGSTAGGIKLLRVLILLKVFHAFVMRSRLSPHTVFEPKIGKQRVQREEVQEAATITALFLSVVVLSWFAFLLSGYDGFDSLFEVVSATGTVGLSTGLTSTELPVVLKLVLCLDMWMGRLEVLPMLLLFNPMTWTQLTWRKS